MVLQNGKLGGVSLTQTLIYFVMKPVDQMMRMNLLPLPKREKEKKTLPMVLKQPPLKRRKKRHLWKFLKISKTF